MNLSRDFHGSKQLAGLKKAWRFDQNGSNQIAVHNSKTDFSSSKNHSQAIGFKAAMVEAA